MLKTIYSLDDLPPPSSNKYIAVLDFSDAGEVGYIYKFNPDTLSTIKLTMLEILFPKDNNGLGLHKIWDILLDTTQQRLVIFNDPLRMLRIHTIIVDQSVELQKIMQSLCNYLRMKGYEEIYVLCSKIMGKFIKALV